ncbi:hypothetical protein LLG46_13455 [bacterium]|nr:hypothetical protein [bacterium]
MIRLFKSALLFFCIYLISATSPILADTKSDFLSSNPNISGWTVGYLDNDQTFAAYNTTFDDGYGIAGWAMNNSPGPKGDVTINYTDQPIDRYGIHWEPGEILVHSPLSSGGVAIKWNATDSAAASVDASFVEHISGASPNIELWSDDTKIYEWVIAGTATQNTISSTSSVSGIGDVLEKSWSLTPNYASEITLVVLPSKGNIASYHLGVFLKVNLKSADVVSSASVNYGCRLPVVQAKTSNLQMASEAGSNTEVATK